MRTAPGEMRGSAGPATTPPGHTKESLLGYAFPSRAPMQRPPSHCPPTLGPALSVALVSLHVRHYRSLQDGTPEGSDPSARECPPPDAGLLTLSCEPTSRPPEVTKCEVCASEPRCSAHPDVTAADEAPRGGGGYFTVHRWSRPPSSLGTCLPGSPPPPGSGRSHIDTGTVP